MRLHISKRVKQSPEIPPEKESINIKAIGVGVAGGTAFIGFSAFFIAVISLIGFLAWVLIYGLAIVFETI
jgi:hypothetical protein